MAYSGNRLVDILHSDIEDWIRNCAFVFTNERDLQVKLAMALQSKTDHYSMVDTEYFVPTNELRMRGQPIPKKGDNPSDFPYFPWHNEISLDIIVCRGDEYAVIELKYFTRPIKWEECIFGEPMSTVRLKNKAAIDMAMYDYCKDIRRIEMVTEAFSSVVGGVALMVANNHLLWEKSKGNPLYFPFSLHENNTFPKGLHTWREGGSERFKKEHPGFKTNAEYRWNWHDTAIPFLADNGDKFRYLLTTIIK